MPPSLYVMKSVMKSAMMLRSDAIKKLSLSVGYCRCNSFGTKRPEAMKMARASNTASIGCAVDRQHVNMDQEVPPKQSTYNDCPWGDALRHVCRSSIRIGVEWGNGGQRD